MSANRFFVQQFCARLEGCEFHHVPQANNETADMLAKLGSTWQLIPPCISLEHLRKPSITPSPESDSIIRAADLNPPPGLPDLGTRQPDPGAGQPDLGAAAQLLAGQEVLTTVVPMIIDKPDENLGAAQQDPGASLPDPRATQRAVPAWAQPLLDYLARDMLPQAEVHLR